MTMFKKIVQWPFPKSLDGVFWRLSSRIIISTVGFISKFILSVLNTTHVFNRHILIDSLDSRPSHVPILTVANHTSCFDDPGLWSVLPLRHVLNIDNIRWALAAHNICFTNRVFSWFFARGKCIPVVRGAGVYQKAVDFSIQQLNQGQWVHIFPEGRVNETNEFIRFKWGVGRIIAESNFMPIVIPLWHVGMDKVLPNVHPYRFKMGNKVVLNFGKPIDLREVIQQARGMKADDKMLRKMITDKIQAEMMILKQKTEKLYSELNPH